jgi:hypothetical protein
MGLQEPSLLGPLSGVEGDLYLQIGLSCDLYKFTGGNWVDASNLVGLYDYYGNPITEPFLFYGLDVNSGLHLIINVVDLLNDVCNNYMLNVNDKILDCCSGNVYTFDGVQWLSDCNLRGPTGPTGPAPTPSSLMFFSSNGTIDNNGRYLGQGSDVPINQYEYVAVVCPGMTVLEFTVRLNTSVVPLGQSITYTLYNQITSVSGSENPLTSITLGPTEYCKTSLVNIGIVPCSTLAVRVTSSYPILGSSASIRFS